MKVVVATDSFKGSLSAGEACEAVRRGLLAVLPDAHVSVRPMADGGEGTADTMLAAGDGIWVPTTATGPLPTMRVDAGFVWLPGRGPGALVEMAKASGLELLRPDELEPLAATTLGTGELVRAAVERGANRLWLAIGGSATVDGGTGLARALGWRFVDARGSEVALGGGALERIALIESPPLEWNVEVQVLCDVDSPLLGEMGAARIFGPQKGATPEVVERLERGLANLADVIERDLGKDVRTIPGGGAAGGLGAGAVAFLDAELVRGIDAVMDACGLDAELVGADWVVTGEGRFDRQSLQGKVVSGVAERARRAGARVAVIAGTAHLSPEEGGVDVVQAASPPGLAPLDAMARAAELVELAAARVARDHLVRG